MVIIGLALGLILGGLLMCFMCKSVNAGTESTSILMTVVWWVGVALVVVGLILLLTPVVVWVNVQLRAMLGQP